MTTPQDPMSQPPQGGYGTPPPSYGQPAGYGAPPPGSGAPELAHWGLRVGGYLVDLAIIIAAELVLGAVSRSLGQFAGLVIFVYFAYLVGTTGQTPGKRAVGIKVLREADGGLLGFGTAIARALLHILDALPFLIGYLWPLWDAKKQTFADKIVHSVVVKT